MTAIEKLLDKWKAEQKLLIDAAAEAGGLPPEKILSKIANLEVAIGALEAAIAEER